MSNHLVRIGAMGVVGEFRSIDRRCYERGMRVVVRTVRGLEVGEILTPPGAESNWREPDGEILRGMTEADEMLAERIARRRDEAFTACQNMLAERQLDAMLLDVEHLFDGQGLYFYFLGEVTPDVDACTAELAEVYDAAVRFRKFTDTLLEGCGPGCGTDAAKGQGGCATCTSCAVAGACRK